MVRQGNAGKNRSRQAASTGRKPGRKSGRKSVSAVYRRRRLFVGIALLMILALTVGGFAALSGALAGGQERVSSRDNSTSATAPAPEGSESPTPTTSAPPATPTCDQNLVTVSASTDKPAYGEGEQPLLSLKVTNGGKLPCEVNIGTSQMEFLVTSGSDRIFSSRDCQASSEDLIKTIAPGQSETANFPWPRNRSVEGCSPVSAKPGAGGAYYVFVAKLGARVSPKAVFQLG